MLWILFFCVSRAHDWVNMIESYLSRCCQGNKDDVLEEQVRELSLVNQCIFEYLSNSSVIYCSHFVIRGNVLSVTDIYSIQGLTWFSCAVCTRFDSLSVIGSTAFSSQAAARSRCKRILGGASTWPSRHSRPAGAHDWRIPPYERHAFARAHRAAAHSAVPHTWAGWSSFAPSIRPLRDGRLEARI